MSHKHADSVLDLLLVSSQKGSVDCSRSDRSVDNMVDFVWLEGKDFTQSSPDFILKHHCFQGLFSWNLFILMGCCNYNRVKIIVAELSCLVSWHTWIVPKHSPIRVPLSHRWTVRNNSKWSFNWFLTSKYSWVTLFSFHWLRWQRGTQRFLL